MMIRAFSEKDAADAGRLLIQKRPELFSDLSENEKKYLSEYAARRFFLNPGFSAVLIEQQTEALMLSAFPFDSGDHENWYNATREKMLSENELKNIQPYIEFFEQSLSEALKHIDLGELLVCVFIASNPRHTERLMTRVIQRCQIHGVSFMYALALHPEDCKHWESQGFALSRELDCKSAAGFSAKLYCMKVPEY